MDTNEKVEYWIEISEYDLKTATAMFKTKRFLYVGFMCHQAIEKILKGHYVFIRSKTNPFSHNLTFLAKESGAYDLFSEEQKNFIDLLEPLNIEARYPTYKEKLIQALDKKKSKKILSQTKELHRWIKEKLLKK